MPLDRDHIRRLFPPAGPAYELFDLSAVLLLVAGPVYLLGHPSAGTRQTLSWLLGPTSQMVWGLLLVAAALIGLVCSYRKTWVRNGYGVVAAAGFLWSSALVIGLVTETVAGNGWQWAGLASATLYGYIARQAAHQARET